MVTKTEVLPAPPAALTDVNLQDAPSSTQSFPLHLWEGGEDHLFADQLASQLSLTEPDPSLW